MKPNVKMKDKSQNSFIFFQIGLIATLVTVFFILEMNFETKKLVFKEPKPKLDIEEVFQFPPKIIEDAVVKANTKPVVKIKQPVPVINTKTIINNAIPSEKEVDDAVTKKVTSEASQNDFIDTTSPEPSSNNNVSEKTPVINHPFAVESLPMFPNCINTNKEAQKECFEKELAKRVYRNLVYPESDVKNNREGKVFFEIIVDENGNFDVLNKVKLDKSTPEMRKAVEVAIMKLPKIIPAKIGGVGVKIRYTIPIVFSLKK